MAFSNSREQQFTLQSVGCCSCFLYFGVIMKKLKKILVIICLFSTTGICQVFGQSAIDLLLGKTTFKMLQGNWEMQHNAQWSAIDTYNSTTCTMDFKTEDGKQGFSDPRSYYLSNSIETTFSTGKVGNTTSGKYKYIIMRGKEVNALVFRIIDITSATLILHNIQTSDILTYKKK